MKPMNYQTDDKLYYPHYWSTYCQHSRHKDCRLFCKTCQSPCLCPCHRPAQPDGSNASYETDMHAHIDGLDRTPQPTGDTTCP